MNVTAPQSNYKSPPYLLAGIAMFLVLAILVCLSLLFFQGKLTKTVAATVTADRSGLVMDIGSKVKLHGLEVGKVSALTSHGQGASLAIELSPAMLDAIPSNVVAEIRPTTIFGAKYIELISTGPSTGHLTAGATIQARNITTEVNTVFQNLTSVLDKIDPAKLNATLGAVADGLRGRGQLLRQTLIDVQSTLGAVNPALPQLQDDLRDAATVTDTFGDAAGDVMSILRNASVSSDTIVEDQKNLEALLLSAIGLGVTGGDYLGQNENGIVDTFRLLTPTTSLLAKYSQSFACIAHIGAAAATAMIPVVEKSNYSVGLDTGLLLGDDPYKYPDNLPEVSAKGGPGGSPGCYPATTWDNYPPPYLRMNTGAPLNGPGTYHPRAANPTVSQYLIDNAQAGSGQP
ncbi:MCE family protein [Rhodococcus qingshengii]|uniref:MCE family protein n=1 Tax=Rhodococcus qingshengii TaxID=334542 RepID=UPI0024BA5C40|nr:MCE family protein [Rhodococcus qingshengii]MDJ0441106.1 MCE family protein [Rhodococcus qingshengii]